MRVTSVVATHDSSSMWRIEQPTALLAARGNDVAAVHTASPALGMAVLSADLVVLSRCNWTDKKVEDAFINMVRNSGAMIVYECDDDNITFQNPLISEWEPEDRKHWPTIVSRNRRLIKKCDAAIVSTPMLAARLKAFMGGDFPVVSVPNLIDLRWWYKLSKVVQRMTPPLSVGWIGARRNKSDIARMLEGWAIVARERPDVHFVTGGYKFDVIADAIPDGRWTHIPWAPLTEYPAVYMQVDIGCAPLAPLQFNRSKSHIKALEYTAGGAATIASRTVYEDFFGDADWIAYAETPEEWAREIITLVDDEELRRRRVSDALEDVFTNWSLENQVHQWLNAYTALLARHEIKTGRAVDVMASV